MEQNELKYGISFYDEENQQHDLVFSYEAWKMIYEALTDKFPKLND